MSRASRLRVFADQDPTNLVLLCDLLDELLTEGRPEEASARLRAAPVGLQTLPAVQFRAARCSLQRADFAGAIALLEPLANGVEVPAGVVHDLAYAQFSLGLFDEALQTLATSCATGEDGVAVSLLKARVLYYQKHYAAALAVLEPLSAGSRMAEVHGLRALLLLDTGETTRAAAEAALALESDPSQHEAAIVAGTVALWERRVDVSQEIFQHVLTQHPRSGRALLGLGQSWMLRGDVAAARVTLERAAVELANHLGTWHALAWCQLLEGDLAGAKRSFDSAFAVDRTFGETHGGLALVHALCGERKEAEESIKRAVRLAPDGSSARYAQSVLLLDDGQPAAAEKIIDGILAQSSTLPVAVPKDFIFRLRELVRPRGSHG